VAENIATLGTGWEYVRIDDASRVAFVQVMARYRIPEAAVAPRRRTAPALERGPE
jgi:hypothetical protein